VEHLGKVSIENDNDCVLRQKAIALLKEGLAR
jgi:hypothetical protein